MSEVLQQGRESAGGDAAKASSQLKAQERPSGKEDSQPADQDEQYKYHQQMLYPTPGQRNYGFSDTFMIHTFKVEPCRRQEKHARGSCPYAHPGDVAQRRPPEAYKALLCPEVRAKKVCPRGNDCQCSHSAFEFWLHPDRYRTSMCEKGERCSRPVCFFAHNEKELRPLPAGLKPAAAAPEETAKRLGTSRTGSLTGGAQFPGEMPGMAAPMYILGPQGRHQAMHRPPLPVMTPGYAYPGYSQHMQAGYSQQMQAGYSQGQATAGYSQAQAAGYSQGPVPGYSQAQVPAGYSPMQAGYRAIPAPPALDVSMAGGYGALMGGQFVPQSPMVSPAGQLMSPGGGMQPQGVTGSPMLMPGAPSAAAVPVSQQFSPMAAGRNSTSSNGSNGGVWQHQPQPPQGRPGPGATTPTGAGMQLPEAMIQQFSQLGGGGAMSPAYQANNTGVMPAMQMPAAQYAQQQQQQQQMVYMQQGPEQGWVQQQASLQQQPRQPHMQYGVPQYAAPVMEQQGSQPMMGRVLPAAAASPAGLLQPAQQLPTAGGAFGMQGAVLTQQWGPTGANMRQPDPNAALAGGMGVPGPPAGPNAFSAQGSW